MTARTGPAKRRPSAALLAAYALIALEALAAVGAVQIDRAFRAEYGAAGGDGLRPLAIALSFLVLLDLATAVLVRFSSPPGLAQRSRQWALLPVGAGTLVVVLGLGTFIRSGLDPDLVVAATVLVAHRFALVALFLHTLRAARGAPVGAPQAVGRRPG